MLRDKNLHSLPLADPLINNKILNNFVCWSGQVTSKTIKAFAYIKLFQLKISSLPSATEYGVFCRSQFHYAFPIPL